MVNPKKCYAVARGRRPGIYDTWYGTGGAEEQIRGYAGALYRGFATREEARQWLRDPAVQTGKRACVADVEIHPAEREIPSGRIVAYTDGACVGNPGSGGYGAVILDGDRRMEIAQGFRLTTNNRMELMACIAALEALIAPAVVDLYSDSRYVVNGICKGWARKWQANGWMRTKEKAAENADLWSRLLDLCERHRVRFVWVRGHAGNRENERCDQLATGAAQSPNRIEDEAYITGRTKVTEGAIIGTG